VAAAVLLAAAAGSGMQAAEESLTTIKGLKCAFPLYAAVMWEKGAPKAETKRTDPLLVQVDEIDVDAGTAREGTAFVTAILTASTLHVLERTMLGSLTVLSVFAEQTPQGTLRAVRSRHDYIQMSVPGFVAVPTVSQHYGECEAIR
jgi:hypothetical protein